MGVFLFSAEYLAECLAGGARGGATADFARDLVPAAARSARVFGYVCDDADDPYYWRTLSTVEPIGARTWSCSTTSDPLCRPTRIGRYSRATSRCRPHACSQTPMSMRAVLSPGSVVAGDVTRSVISTRCRIGADAVIRDSVLLPGAIVGARLHSR